MGCEQLRVSIGGDVDGSRATYRFEASGRYARESTDHAVATGNVARPVFTVALPQHREHPPPTPHSLVDGNLPSPLRVGLRRCMCACIAHEDCLHTNRIGADPLLAI
jgi:hypothetical protein